MNNWYYDIDVATLQRIKTYSAFCDYKSQNLMLQTLYEAMQKKIDEYKKTNREIAKDFAALRKQVPQWHKVADGDLPKENHFVLVLNKQTGYEIARHAPFEEYLLDNWVTIDNRCFTQAKNNPIIIAWCEIPKYTEE